MTPNKIANTPRKATAHQLRANAALMSSFSDHPAGPKNSGRYSLEEEVGPGSAALGRARLSLIEGSCVSMRHSPGWSPVRMVRLRGAPAFVGGILKLRIDDAFVLPAGTASARAGLLCRRGEPCRDLCQLLDSAADQVGIGAGHCQAERRDRLFNRGSVGLAEARLIFLQLLFGGVDQ